LFMVSIQRTDLEGCTRWDQQLSTKRIVEFSSAVVVLKTLDSVSSGINLGMVLLIGGDASLLFFIRKVVYCGPACIVVNE
jgi:hypothetical protein